MAMEETVSTAPDPLREAGTLLLLVRVLDQQLRVTTTPNPVTISELSVLGNVSRGINSPSTVARSLRMDPARVTHLVDGLVADSALTREVDPADRRRWQLALTEAGRRKLAEGRDRLCAAMEAALEGLTKEERHALSEGIAGLRRVLQAQTEPAAAAASTS